MKGLTLFHIKVTSNIVRWPIAHMKRNLTNLSFIMTSNTQFYEQTHAEVYSIMPDIALPLKQHQIRGFIFTNYIMFMTFPDNLII